MEDLIKKIDEIQRLYKESDELMEQDEAKSDELYAEAYRLADEAGAEIHRITGGRVNYQTACQMVWQYPEKLKSILKKAA